MESAFWAQPYLTANRTNVNLGAASTIPAKRSNAGWALSTALLKRCRKSLGDTFSDFSACELVEGGTLLAVAACASAFMVAALTGSASLG